MREKLPDYICDGNKHEIVYKIHFQLDIMKKVSDNIKYEHLVAGLTGGVASTLVLHPFDLVKVRFQGMLDLRIFC